MGTIAIDISARTGVTAGQSIPIILDRNLVEGILNGFVKLLRDWKQLTSLFCLLPPRRLGSLAASPLLGAATKGVTTRDVCRKISAIVSDNDYEAGIPFIMAKWSLSLIASDLETP